ncbi:adenine-specific DNA-methyltransferase [Bartonella japonica]|uniref:site-specific DNA-methyltransferase (adenine-specific) n=1 Tax=Bartonella japonica TaxID=357761 RepID=A0ABV2FLQ1_9HYPH
MLALKALEQEYTGKVKCIYLDPPYNTGNAFEHYDDDLEHSIWLRFMRDRLELLHRLLVDDGSIWISIDDNEQAYLKVMMDEIFGRHNFLADVIWHSTKSVTNTALISTSHTHNLVYFKDKSYWIKNRTQFRIPEEGKGFSNPDNDPRGPWKADPFQVGGWRPNQQYEIINPKTGKFYIPNKGCSWKNEYNKFCELLVDNRIVFGKNNEARPQRKRFLSEALSRGRVATTLWTDVETTTNATQHSKALFGDHPFTNPKPESFISKILNLTTKPSDLVLDSFLGSGTTAAVAHKMGRRWIGIELGNHCETHCIPRLKQVIDGSDQGGISKVVNWQGGGGFRYYRLAPSMLEKDKWGNWVISKEYNAVMLVEALCKIMGFTYAPSEVHYWEHGKSNENDFIYVTTQMLDQVQLKALCEEVGATRTLVVCCTDFRANIADYPNLTVKKIPHTILKNANGERIIILSMCRNFLQ